MSFGNTVTQGSKGANAPYQRGMLELLRKEHIAIGYEKLAVTGGVAQKLLQVPKEANYMEIRVESGTTTGIIMRQLQLGDVTPPTTTDGMALLYLDLFDVSGRENILNFRVISVAGTHTLHVQYYR